MPLPNSFCFQFSWPEKKMVANDDKYQFNILPSSKINVFPLLAENGRDTQTQNHKALRAYKPGFLT